MLDQEIVNLYWNWDEKAIMETKQKYGCYLLKIAQNILNDSFDSEECINDTYLKAWNSIPPHSPIRLSLYLAKITREVSIDLLRYKNRIKRHSSQYTYSLSELEECIGTRTSSKDKIDLLLSTETIQSFLNTLPEEERSIFLEPYYFMDPIADIAKHHAFSVAKTKIILYRIRKLLRLHLIKEGYSI